MAERDAKVKASRAIYLARALVSLDVVGKALTAWRGKYAAPVDSFLVREHDMLTAEVDKQMRRYLTTVSDSEFLVLGPTRWARRIIARAKREKQATEQRRAARATRPTAKVPATKAVAKQRAATGTGIGFCDACGKAREEPNMGGLCPTCIDKLYPRIRRK